MKIIFFFLLSQFVFAESITLTWDANVLGENVKAYRLSYVKFPELVRTMETETLIAKTENLSPGVWNFSVLAINHAGVVSHESETLLHTVLAPTSKMLGVEIQKSSNLQDWQTITIIPLNPDEVPSQFVRARIITIR